MRKTIALVTGGYSGELEISLKSAAEVFSHLDREAYEVFMIMIEKDAWYYKDDNGTMHPVDRNGFTINMDNRTIHFDCVFIVIHGTPGEDGKLQGYFDLIGIPYTSCGRTTSAVTFNKFFTNKIARSLGINTADSIFFHKSDPIDINHVIGITGLPCFVKPNNGGSSVGVSRVDKAEQLMNAINSAFEQDNEVVIEEYIRGFEITCGMIRYKGELIVFPLTEIISKKDFFDYEAKYTDGLAEEITPARIDDSLKKHCEDTSRFLYTQLNCKGIVRFDYIVSGDRLFFLEVNTIPGFTRNSIVPGMVRSMGLSPSELYSMAIEEAVGI
jgi:D-alanine-D-alanine ligase